jgi:hypothetical protein
MRLSLENLNIFNITKKTRLFNFKSPRIFWFEETFKLFESGFDPGLIANKGWQNTRGPNNLNSFW